MFRLSATALFGLLVAVGSSACDDGSLVAVDLRTDFVPGVEFSRVRLEVVPEEGLGRSVENPVTPGADYVVGSRVGEVDGLAAGTVRLRVDLLDDLRGVVASRTLVAEVDGSLGITIVMTRDCRGVTCPAPGGDPSLEACLAGRCVDPRCTAENPSACGAPECVGDADCPAPAGACAAARCSTGVCLEVGATACAAGEYCDPSAGCTPRPTTADASVDAGVDATDGGAPLLALISLTRLSTASEFSYVTLEVDWTRRLAYLGSRESGVCLAVADFGDETAPRILGTFDVTSTPPMPGNRCLGLALIGERYLLVSAEETGAVASFDLGADPRALSFTSVDSVALANARSIAVEPGASAVVVGYRGGAQRIPVDATARFARPADVALGCELDEAVPFDGLALGGCWPNGEPIHLLDFGAGASVTTFDMDNGGTSGLWTGAITADRRTAFVGGWVSAFFEIDPDMGSARLAFRYDNDSSYRDATFVRNGARTELWVTASGDNRVEVWDATDVDAPTLVHDAALPLMGRELYAIEVDPVSRRAVVASNDGWLAILDIDLMPGASRPVLPF